MALQLTLFEKLIGLPWPTSVKLSSITRSANEMNSPANCPDRARCSWRFCSENTTSCYGGLGQPLTHAPEQLVYCALSTISAPGVEQLPSSPYYQYWRSSYLQEASTASARLNLILTHTRPSSRAEITSVGISPSSRAAFAISPGPQTSQSWIDIFDLDTHKGLSKITGPSAAFPPPGGSSTTRVATVRDWAVQLGGGVEFHHASTLMIRDYATGKMNLELKEANGLPITWSHDGKAIAAAEGPSSSRMGIWDARTGARLGRVVSHIDTITHAAFTADFKIVTLSKDGTLRVTNPLTSKTLSKLEIEGPASSNPRALASSPDGTTIVSIWGTTLHIWLTQGNHLTSYNLNSVRCSEGWPLCFSADCKLLACWTESGFDIMDVATGAVVAEGGNRGELVTAGAFSSDGRVLLLGKMNGDVESWDVVEK